MFDVLYCHIGSHKTGTTSIQDSFQSNTDALHTAGVHFVARRAGILAHVTQFPTRIVPGLIANRSPEHVRSFINSAIDDLATSAASPNLKTALLSSEDMLALPPSDVLNLHRFLQRFARKLKVIYYVRHPLGRIPSIQAQAIKTGHAKVGPPDARYLERYERQLARWIETFGIENVDVRVFSTNRDARTDPVADICAAIAHPDLHSALNVLRRNDGLSYAALLIASALTGAGKTMAPRKPVIELLQKIEGGKYTCDPDVLNALLSQALGDLAYLQQIFGISLDAPPIPRHTTDRNEIFDDATLASLGAVLQNAARQNDRTLKEIATIQAKIDALRPADQP